MQQCGTRMENDIEKVLVTEEEIEKICDRVAAEITKDYEGSGRDLVLVIILKGSVMFATDLARRIPLPLDMEFMKVSSYGAGTHTSGFIQIHLDLKRDIQGADVIVVEDIVDSGRTLHKLFSLLSERKPHSIRCCTLLDKPARRQVELKADYVGTEIPDGFVVGYGLDYDQKYRNLPYIGVLKREVYEKEPQNTIKKG